jgi:hypothetical protein
MAKFSESFLQQLGRPGWSEGMFGLGQAIGGAQGQVRDQRKKQEFNQLMQQGQQAMASKDPVALSAIAQQLAAAGYQKEAQEYSQAAATAREQQDALGRFDRVTDISSGGITAAQQGNVESLEAAKTGLMAELAGAGTLKQKEAIRQELRNLDSLMPGAKKLEIGNKARKLVNINKALQNSDLTGTEKLALEQQQKELQLDPEAMEQFQQYQLNTWRFQQEGEKIKEEQWLDTNRGAILEAVQNGDTKALNSVIEGAGEYAEAAQKFADSSLRSAETMAQFEENSIERKMAPSVDYYVEQVDNLPEEIGQNLKTTLAAYKAVSEKGWDGKQWTAGLRTRAKQLERELQGQLRAINSQIATSEYFEAKREDRATKEQIKKIEIKLDAPMGSDYIKQGRIMAQSLLKKGDELTQNDIMTQATALYERDRRQLIQELASLTGEEPVEEEEVKENKDSPYRIINGRKLSLSEVKEDVKEFGETEVRRLLKEQGATEEDIAFYFTSEPTEREKRMKALGPRDERMDAIGTGFVARTDALGPRAERMKSLGPREERMVSLFN